MAAMVGPASPGLTIDDAVTGNHDSCANTTGTTTS
jgi:hypothetical protein